MKTLMDYFALASRLFVIIMRSYFYAAYGLIVVVRALLGFPRWASKLRSGLRDTVRCPNGHENSSLGRWACAACGAESHGWVGTPCPICGSSADWIVCAECGVGVRLPWTEGD